MEGCVTASACQKAVDLLILLMLMLISISETNFRV